MSSSAEGENEQDKTNQYRPLDRPLPLVLSCIQSNHRQFCFVRSQSSRAQENLGRCNINNNQRRRKIISSLFAPSRIRPLLPPLLTVLRHQHPWSFCVRLQHHIPRLLCWYWRFHREVSREGALSRNYSLEPCNSFTQPADTSDLRRNILLYITWSARPTRATVLNVALFLSPPLRMFASFFLHPASLRRTEWLSRGTSSLASFRSSWGCWVHRY